MPIRFIKSIFFKIAASILLVEAVVMIVLFMVYTRQIRRSIDMVVREQITLPGRLIYEKKLDPNSVADRATMEHFLNRDYAHMNGGLLMDSTGRILASDIPGRIGQNAFALGLVRPEGLRDFWVQGHTQTIIPVPPLQMVCITAAPAQGSGDAPRFSVFLVHVQAARQVKASVARFFAVGTVVGVLLTWLAILIIFRTLVSRRIRALITMLQRVEKGDLNARVEGDWVPDEIGLIQRRMNAIVAQLQETIQVLENRLFDLKESESEKEKIQTQFYQVQKMEALGVLTGGVAHDFNNLLTAIQGCADMAILHIDETSPAHQDLKEIQHAARRATDLTRQLLLFSRRQPMTFTPVNLNAVIEDLYKLLHRLIGEDIGISMPVELDLWTIQADKGCLEQLITNLAVNAKDAMQQGGLLTFRTENVELTEAQCQPLPRSRPGFFVRMTVADTGTGMGPEILEHIFEPFFSTKEPGKGTGLGLSVVYGIVEQHNGFIHVTSRPGQGSVFEIYLPAVPEKAVGKIDAVHPDLELLQGRGERILVVEDETGVREYLQSALKRNGYEVDVASKATEALDRFEKRNHDFHLVFIDVVLPDRNGVELVEELLDRKPDLGVLLSSGYTEKRSWWSLIEKKKYPYLQKPYRMVHLLKIIRDVLDNRKDA